MRIKTLHLRRYGHFEDRTLEFADSGLTVIYGPNETGKSTSLSAIADLLFGFGHSTRYDFRFDSKLLRIGATLASRTGQEISFFRRKGNRGTLLDLEEKPLPDSALLPFLGQASRDFFEKTFGLSYERLRQGGDAIAQAEGELGQILFEAGSGIRGLAEVQQKLAEEAEAIFTVRKSSRALYQALEAYETASRELKQASLRRQEWIDAGENLRSAGEALQQARETLRGLQAAQARLHRWERVLPILGELDLLRAALAQLGPESCLPADARERCLRAMDRLRHEEQSLAEAGEQLLQTARQIGECSVNEALLGAFPAIRDLYERAAGIEERLAKLPALETELGSLEIQIAARAQELDLPLEEGRPLLPKKAHLSRLLELASARHRLDGELERAVSEEASLRIAAEELQEELSRLGEVSDPRSERLLLQDLETVHAGLGDTRTQERSLKGVEGRLETLRERLPWWEGSLEELLSAPLPSQALVEQFRRGLERTEWDLETAQEKYRTTRTAWKRAESKVAAHRERESFYSDEDLAAVRQRRQTAWELVRRALEGEPMPPPPELVGLGEPFVKIGDGGTGLAPLHERLSIEADRIADFRLACVEEVARDKQLREALSAACFDVEAAKAEFESAAKAHEDQLARWRDLWAPLEVTPLSPEEMKEGLGHVEAAREKSAEREQLVDQMKGAEKERASVLQRIRALVRHLQLEEYEADDAKSLLSRMKAALEERSAAHSAGVGVRNRMEELQKQQVRKARESAELKQQLAGWERQWEECCARVRLSPQSSVLQAQQSVEAWDELSRRTEVLGRTAALAKESEALIQQFTESVCEAAVAAGEPTDSLPPSQAVTLLRRLYTDCRKAQNAAARREELLAMKHRLEETIAKHREQIRTAAGELQTLKDLAGAESEEALFGAIAAGEEQRKLRERLEEAQQRLWQAGSGTAEQELRAQGAGISADTLPADLADLLMKVEAQERMCEEAARREETARTNLTTVEAKAGGHRHVQAVEHARARMGAQARDYLRLQAASLMLARGIERIRDKHKNPILLRAGAHFQALTGGSFTGAETGFDSKDRPAIVGVRPGGERVHVQGMSDGTRDQLYLALRLAFVEQHCATEEPLPFIGDDLFVHFDDERTAAGLELLAALPDTQVILFTHHQHLLDLAQNTLGDQVQLINLSEAEVLAES